LAKTTRDAIQYKDDLEQYTRKNSLRIFGVPEQKNENTDEVVSNICKNKLGIDVPAHLIDCSHRLPGREPYHRPIIVKFISRNTKKNVFTKKRLLKGSNIVITEDLTKLRYQLMKNASKKFGPKNVWSSDGKIFVKLDNSIKVIRSNDDLC
jgi:hypothetical protein